MSVTSNAPSRTAVRQRRHREKKRQADVIEITVWVPSHAACGMKILAAQLCENPELEVGNPKSRKTGRMVKLS